jgi:hypothetical protein
MVTDVSQRARKKGIEQARKGEKEVGCQISLGERV